MAHVLGWPAQMLPLLQQLAGDAQGQGPLLRWLFCPQDGQRAVEVWQGLIYLAHVEQRLAQQGSKLTLLLHAFPNIKSTGVL